LTAVVYVCVPAAALDCAALFDRAWVDPGPSKKYQAAPPPASNSTIAATHMVQVTRLRAERENFDDFMLISTKGSSNHNLNDTWKILIFGLDRVCILFIAQALCYPDPHQY
jgi:hypothetical protein